MSSLSSPQPVGAPNWVDLSSPDVHASIAFYSELLGWEFSEPATEFGNYTRATFGGDEVAGAGSMMDGGFPAWTLYFRTDDSAAAAEAISASGGTLIAGPMQVGDFGHMTIAQDPTGAFFGLWENLEMTGFQAFGTRGALAWSDLRSPDPDRAREFYGPLLGWSFAPVEMAGPSYTTAALSEGGEPVVGLGDFMGVENIPPHWAVYFVCDDTDAAVARVTELGGQAFTPPFDTPYGRMAAVADPQGAAFWLMSVPS